MAKKLNFVIDGGSYEVETASIDRKKLYGWNEVLALDDNGNECRLVSMDESGTVIIPPKGTAQALLSVDKKWVDKSAVSAVNLDGTPAQMVKSSYDIPINLTEKATIEEYLNHTISLFYQLYDVPVELIEYLKKDIYKFTYSFRDSYEGRTAFLLENDGNVFMLVGSAGNFEMIGLQETVTVDEDSEDEDESGDDFDFSSMF